MLSILIPVYNYNIYGFVQELHKQATNAGITFEIVCLDDASKKQDCINANQPVNLLDNCSYKVLDKNIGRCSIRNLLAKKAKYTWLLFLDADTYPTGNSLITNYLPYINNDVKVVYGGILYKEQQPAHNELLRWVYGNEREALPVAIRQQEPYKSILTLNFLIHRQVFDIVAFNEAIPNLRHDDTLFTYDLSKSNIPVLHIHNPVYHLGLETSEIFIHKSEQSVIGLKYLTGNNYLDKNYVRLAGIYFKIKRLGLRPLLMAFYTVTKTAFKKNLLGKKPSLLIFDLYRLGYLASLK